MAPPNNFNDENNTTRPVIENDKNAAEKLMDWEAPKAQGLYDPQNEHDACGVGFIVAIDGRRNHKVSVMHRITQLFPIRISMIRKSIPYNFITSNANQFL